MVQIKTEPWTGGTEEEYETQHFGFGAKRLKIAVRQMIEQKIISRIKDMETSLKESWELNDTDKTTIKSSCDKLIKMYCERAGPSLEIIDGEIESALKIPSNVLLPGDEVQKEDVSSVDHESLKKEVAGLRKRVERGAMMEALLLAEEEDLASVEKVCETANKDMEVLDLLHKSIDNNGNLKSIQNDTEFLCASAPFMKKTDESGFFDD